MARLFGTDGVRGIIILNYMACNQLGQAGAYVLTSETAYSQNTGWHGHKDIGPHAQAARGGICPLELKPYASGDTDPAVAYLTRLYKADAGVVISASHNFEFNGIKFLTRGLQAA